MAGKQYVFSEFGEAVHPWINKPDTKFNADGVYKVGLRQIINAPVRKQMDEVKQEAVAAFERYAEEKGFTAKQRKDWKVYLPYEVEEDDQGVPTGTVLWHFKQNAVILLRPKKEGAERERKDISISVKDMQNKDTKVAIFSGATIRVAYAMRDNPSTSNRQVGVRLDFAAVQVKDPGKRGSGGGGGINFGTGEGFTAEEDEGDPSVEGAEPEAQGGHGDAGGDY